MRGADHQARQRTGPGDRHIRGRRIDALHRLQHVEVLVDAARHQACQTACRDRPTTRPPSQHHRYSWCCPHRISPAAASPAGVWSGPLTQPASSSNSARSSNTNEITFISVPVARPRLGSSCQKHSCSAVGRASSRRDTPMPHSSPTGNVSMGSNTFWRAYYRHHSRHNFLAAGRIRVGRRRRRTARRKSRAVVAASMPPSTPTPMAFCAAEPGAGGDRPAARRPGW